MTLFFTEICPDCGNLRSVCSDPNALPYPQRSVCFFTAARAVVWRRIHKKHGQPEWDDPNPHVTDGWVVGMSQYDLTPDDDFGGALSVLPSQQPEGQ